MTKGRTEVNWIDFGTIFGKAIFNPATLFDALANSSRCIFWGWVYTLGFSFLYSLTALQLYIRGWHPVVEPIIPISIRGFYLAQTFFTIPVTLATIGLGTIVAYGLARLMNSTARIGAFWGTLSIAAVIPALITMWIPETFFIPFLEPQTLLSPPYDTVRIFAGSIWSVLLTILAIRSSARVNWFKSLLIAIPTAAVIGLTTAVFYR